MNNAKDQFIKDFEHNSLNIKWEIKQINQGKNKKIPSLKVFLKMRKRG